MAEIEWDKSGQRFYEAGVDRGVLYPKDSKGVPWNGLISVDESSTGGDPSPLYLDGLKYENRNSPEEFKATIEAFTYPDEFSTIMGDVTSGSGLYFGQQPPQEFGLSYRTMIGTDLDQSPVHYKIHIIYNALASISSIARRSRSAKSETDNLSWDITTRGVVISGRKPTAELVIDTRYTDPDRVAVLERALYGWKTMEPRLPSPQQVVTLFDDWPFVEIIPRPTSGFHWLKYRGLMDLKGDAHAGLYSIPKESRLREYEIKGLFTL